MFGYIKMQIEYHQELINSALDNGDHVAAIQSRAAQRELEKLIERFTIKQQVDVNSDSGFEREQYYTTSEAAKILGLTPPSVTRNGKGWSGIMTNGCWYFPKSIIQEQLQIRESQKKRGRKSNSN